jgi:hypothetical protein
MDPPTISRGAARSGTGKGGKMVKREKALAPWGARAFSI